MEALVKSGIEDICIIRGSEEEREEYHKFFETPLPQDHFAKLNPEAQEYENRILEIGKHLHYVYQKEKRGFGHAVYQAVEFANNEPVMLLLGDTIYHSHTNKPCALQLIEQYEKYNMLTLSIHDVPLADVSHYGILTGTWEDKDEKVMSVSRMVEKPKASYAEEFLYTRHKDGSKHYKSVFGQYILTPEVFEQLHDDIINSKDDEKEIELTAALDKVRERNGMIAVQLDGEMYDMGNYNAYKNCIKNY